MEIGYAIFVKITTTLFEKFVIDAKFNFEIKMTTLALKKLKNRKLISLI